MVFEVLNNIPHFDKSFAVVAICPFRAPCLLSEAALLRAIAPLSQKIFDFSGALRLPRRRNNYAAFCKGGKQAR